MGSAVGGLVGGVFGSSSTPSVPTLSTFQPTGTQAFDQTYQNLSNQNVNSNPYTSYNPQIASTFAQSYQNPYAGSYQTGANNAGNASTLTGDMLSSTQQGITNSAMSLLPATQQILANGFDPQSQLYARTLQQLNDSVNVNSAQRGITNSPYGASVANAADSNFNIDWQNNELQRQISALNAAGTGVSQGASNVERSGMIGAQGAQAQLAGGATPFTASQGVTGGQTNALTNLLAQLGQSGAQGYNNNNLANIMSYLGLGASQANEGATLNQANYGNQLKASQSASSGFGGIGSSIFSLLNGAGNGDAGGISSLLASLGGSGGVAAAAPDLMALTF